MNIIEGIRKNQRALSRTNLEFLDFVQRNPAALNESCFANINGQYPFQAWPLFIDRAFSNRLKKAALSVLKLIEDIPFRFFDNDHERMADFYGYSAEHVRYCMEGVTPDHLHSLMARGDFVVTPAMEIKCIEYNVASNIGGLDLPTWENMYLRNPLISQFLDETGVKITNPNMVVILFEHLIDTFRKNESLRANSGNDINTVLSIKGFHPAKGKFEMGAYVNRIYGKLLKERYGDGVGGEAVFCDRDFLEKRDDFLYYGDKKVSILLEYTPRVIPLEIMSVAWRNHLYVVNGVVSPIVTNKLNLAVLSENQHSDIFSDAEKESIQKHVPWTRKILPGKTTYDDCSIQMEEFLRENREQL
ncbi:MAG: hypothetical protein GY765_29825, partial [bacterium]|nr:hypothetical protein [bacterium]